MSIKKKVTYSLAALAVLAGIGVWPAVDGDGQLTL